METSEVKLQVTVRFEGKYPEDRIEELMAKVADALYDQYGGAGLVPEDSEDVLTEGANIKHGNTVLVDSYYDQHVMGRYTHTLHFPEDGE